MAMRIEPRDERHGGRRLPFVGCRLVADAAIEQGVVSVHGAGNGEAPVGDTAEHPARRASACPEGGMVRGLFGSCWAAPRAEWVHRGATLPRAALAQFDPPGWAAAPGHRGDPGSRPRDVVVSRLNGQICID